MKLTSLKCPECNGNLDINCEGRKYIFCPFCGSQISIQNSNEYTININKTSRKINDADVIRAQNEKSTNALALIVGCIMFIGVMILCGLIVLSDAKPVKEGKISAGDHYDYEKMNYNVVIKKFENMGFEYVDSIELNNDTTDENDKKVESVSINGKSDFYDDDYFNKTDKVLIVYY